MNRLFHSLLAIAGIVLAFFNAYEHAFAADYQPPPGSARSTLVFDRHGTEAMVVIFYTNGNNCTAKGNLPERGQPFWEGKPIALESGREFAFRLRGLAAGFVSSTSISSSACDITFSFKPEANADYKLDYVFFKEEKRCEVSLARLEKDEYGVRAVPEPTFKRRMLDTTASGDKPACAPVVADATHGNSDGAPPHPSTNRIELEDLPVSK